MIRSQSHGWPLILNFLSNLEALEKKAAEVRSIASAIDLWGAELSNVLNGYEKLEGREFENQEQLSGRMRMVEKQWVAFTIVGGALMTAAVYIAVGYW